jgi:hypothetical protein
LGDPNGYLIEIQRFEDAPRREWKLFWRIASSIYSTDTGSLSGSCRILLKLSTSTLTGCKQILPSTSTIKSMR